MTIAPAPGLPRVTVVVVGYQSAAVIADCLRSLAAAFDGAADTSVVVVDNASTDGTLDVARAVAPHARVVALSSNRGYAAAINAGVAADAGHRADAVLVLNPDVRLAAGSGAPLLAALATPGTGIAVPRLVDAAGRTHRSLRRAPTILRALGEAVLGGRAGRVAALGEVVTDPRAYESATAADWATGAAMLISRRCLDVVGPWDESLFLYSEEVDFALRARDAGFAVRYEPAARAEHLGGPSASDPALWSMVVQNKLRLYRRRHGRGASAAYATAVLGGELVRAAVGRSTSRAAVRAVLRRQVPGPIEVDGTVGAEGGIVCFSAQDWWYFNRAHSDFQLLVNAAATGRQVLLVNSLGMRMPVPGRTTAPLARIVRKLASVTKGLRHPLPDVPTFAVLTPLFLPVYRAGRLRAASNRFVAWQVRRAAAHLGIADPAVVVTLPTAWEVAATLPRRVLLANRSDRYSAFGEADGPWVAELERDLLAHADVALYASRALLERERHLTANPVFLDHGVDLDRFDPAAVLDEPARLRAIPHPRLGFFGALDDYTVDLDLLARLADELPDAHVVLVGPSNCDIDDLTARPNVHWLGACEPAEVPAYGLGFDVALMPWLDNDWIAHCNPIKLKEYLALGLPVVSTPFPEIEHYADVVRIARTADDVVALVRQTLADGGIGTPASRRASVAGASWAGRAAHLLELADRGAEELACAAS